MSDSEKQDTILTTNPIIIDMGERRAQEIRQMKRGEGELLDEVNEIIDEVSDSLKGANKDTVFMPVIIVLERKN